MSRYNNAPSTKPLESSQDIIDKFWKSIISPAITPTKASAVLPPNVYGQFVKSQVPHGVTVAEYVDVSYQKARAICEKKVAQIVKECTMINQKYSDPYFNLSDRGQCLYRLRANSRPSSPGPPGAGDPGVSFDITRGPDISGKLVLYDPPLPPPPRGRLLLQPPSVKRVGDIFDKPQFFVDGASASDIRQGYDGDCWFLSALMTLCNLQPTSHMIDRVCVARDQDVGVYGFVLYRDGEWISVVIDDKLYLRKPDYEDTDEQVRRTWEDNRNRVNSAEEYRKECQSNSRALYYAQSTDPNETWVPLIEKAFAKAHGDYAAIEAGSVGEGVEDLTGGISTTILTANILSKDRFWKDLLKVNKEFLFGCGTANWDDPYGEGRDGIHGGHAYSVLAAKEYKDQRLVLMKNPWGDHEWNGPWSDGSKEWTPEAMTTLGHTFGDDGVFWIRYEDMLRKYEVIWRTRLFTSEWKVTQQWTTLAVPWAGEYQDAKFEVIIAKSAPTVIVLSQLDDRYFRGLTGQYRFSLSFRVHRAGDDEYISRTFPGEDVNDRSVSVELPLEEGTYEVRLRITASRDEDEDKVEDVVKDNWLDRRDKLLQIGLSYDLAHAKAEVREAPETKGAKPTVVTRTRTVTKETSTKTTTTETTKTDMGEIESKTEKNESKDTTDPHKDKAPVSKAEKAETSAAEDSSKAAGKGAAPNQSTEAPLGQDGGPQKGPEEEEGKPDDDKASVVSGGSVAPADEEQEMPWAAVCVVGLRVFCKDADASIQIVRPKEPVETEAEKVNLDVDNPAADATGAVKGNKTEETVKEVVKETIEKEETETEEKTVLTDESQGLNKPEDLGSSNAQTKPASLGSDDAVVVDAADAAEALK